jgi:hypothetical protein
LGWHLAAGNNSLTATADDQQTLPLGQCVKAN